MISLDIKSYGDYPSNQLSNFYPHTFIFKGVPCGSKDTKKSILTEDEFCSRLTNLRNMRL